MIYLDIPPCDVCGSEEIEIGSDGLQKQYFCEDCGEVLAEIGLGAEP